MRRKKTKLERSKKCGNCGIQITDSRYLRKRSDGQTWCAWCANPKLRCLTLRQRKIMELVGRERLYTHDEIGEYVRCTDDQVEQELVWLEKQGLVQTLEHYRRLSAKGRKYIGR